VASHILRARTRSAKGEVSDEDNQQSDVFFNRGGVWKIVFLHYSPAPKKKAQQGERLSTRRLLFVPLHGRNGL